MRVPRHLKHPVALWLIDGRGAFDPRLTTRDIALRLDVDEATVRRWETARAGSTKNLPSPEHVEALERILGRPSPERSAPPLEATIAAALAYQTRLLEQLVSREAPASYEAEPTIDPKVLRRRRAYWLERARRRLKLTTQTERLKLLGWPSDRAARLGQLERGEDDPKPFETRDFVRAYRIPERILADPPPTDEERLEEWQEIVLVELPAAATEPVKRRRTA